MRAPLNGCRGAVRSGETRSAAILDHSVGERAYGASTPAGHADDGSRYPVQYLHLSTPGPQAGPLDFPALPGGIVLPPAQAVAATADPGALLDVIVPGLAGILRLKVTLGPGVTPPIRPLLLDIATIPQPPHIAHIVRGSGLEPLDEKPVSDHFQDDAPASSPLFGGPSVKAHLWIHAANLWKLAPRDLKLLAFAIPALLALAFHRELPKVHVAAPTVSTAQLRSSIHNVVNTQLTTVRQALMERAGVALDDDFRSGLDDWASRGDATAEWSFDPTGFVRPGPLALYRPSMNLSDYRAPVPGHDR